ncbi:protease modulator HflC [Sphingomonas panacisoli]|uniref:Protein HflC n=1 Tax=Sphingomonas panacisoli TaxID=1813879 RepID=A0A5B8LGA1_9SPHN|nr:protease modulator HflC [Sphingomonas panacisoli]QDZ06684.1 protease modulator HflC [Sphingomonas panacisoli]
MSNWLRNPITLGIVALLLVILLASTVAIVPETRQAVIVRLEKPLVKVNAYHSGEKLGETGAGVIARVPFIDRIVWLDKRVLDVDLNNLSVLSTDQRPLDVDAYARFRIVDPMRALQAVGLSSGAEERVTSALQQLFGSAVRNELSSNTFADLLSPERRKVMDSIQSRLQQVAAPYGVEIIDVRIKHADLPAGTPLDSAIARMRNARFQQAQVIRSQGQKDAAIIRADAQAQAAQIYALAFNKDPVFYDFYRAMQSYRQTFAPGTKDQPKGDTNLILTPDNAYLKQFEGGGK